MGDIGPRRMHEPQASASPGRADGGRVAEEGVAVAGQAVDALMKPVGLALSSRQLPHQLCL